MDNINDYKVEFLIYLEKLINELSRKDFYELKRFIKTQVEE